MVKTKTMAAALACAAIAGVQAPAVAQQQQQPQPVRNVEQDKATNSALLQALIARRAELGKSGASAESTKFAREFLDKQIESVKAALAQLEPSTQQ